MLIVEILSPVSSSAHRRNDPIEFAILIIRRWTGSRVGAFSESFYRTDKSAVLNAMIARLQF
jgi:hypothetical protein